jgi:hypothetical protein
MGYSTDFMGALQCTPELKIKQAAEINEFSEDRHDRPGFPGIWCQWIINDEGELVWDGGEKFYNYVEWLKYLIENYFQPWGVLLNGEIEWQGESMEDRGMIVVVDNVVTTKSPSYI